MRLWHEKLIPQLPRQQLLGQHRECCALRGMGWKKPHATVNYVFNHPFRKLVAYHFLVMKEMKQRGYQVSEEWWDPAYRGKAIGYVENDKGTKDFVMELSINGNIYPEHDDNYLDVCMKNLINKQIFIDIG